MQNGFTNEFPELAKDIRRRFVRPLGSPSFWMFLLVGVIGFGGIAIWIEVLKCEFRLLGTANAQGVLTAINTYFPAIGCGAGLQIVTWEKQKPNLRACGMAAWSFMSAACVVLLLLQANHPWWSGILGAICSIFALAMWWLANGEEDAFQNGAPTNASIGGNLDQPLAGGTRNWTT
jgi:hypothetical protein